MWFGHDFFEIWFCVNPYTTNMARRTELSFLMSTRTDYIRLDPKWKQTPIVDPANKSSVKQTVPRQAKSFRVDGPGDGRARR